MTNTDKVDDSILSDYSTMDQAKESISRIEESTTRIHSIINGNNKPNVIRSNSRRRDDYPAGHFKNIFIVAIVISIVSLCCMSMYMFYEVHTSNSLTVLTNKISNLEVEIQKLSPKPSQSSGPSQ